MRSATAENVHVSFSICLRLVTPLRKEAVRLLLCSAPGSRVALESFWGCTCYVQRSLLTGTYAR